MKNMEFSIETTNKRQIVDITQEIQQRITSKKIDSGITLVVVLHTTCAITTADLDPGTDLDFLDFLEAITPKLHYRHPHNPAHAPDHLLASLIGPSVSLAVEDGKLRLGSWQRIILVELDGPRERQLVIKTAASD